MRNGFVILAVWAMFFAGCASIEYSVVVVEAAQAVASAEVAGAPCTSDQLEGLSPSTENAAPDPGTALATSDETLEPEMGAPMCYAPYEYYSSLEYLHKAREEVGYSDYEAAIRYARQARAFALKATDISFGRNQERGR